MQDGLLSVCEPVQAQPAELFQEYTTIEYAVPATKQVQPPAYVFVVDTSVAEDELRAAVASLSQALTTLPEYAQVRTRGIAADACTALPGIAVAPCMGSGWGRKRALIVRM